MRLVALGLAPFKESQNIADMGVEVGCPGTIFPRLGFAVRGVGLLLKLGAGRDDSVLLRLESSFGCAPEVCEGRANLKHVPPVRAECFANGTVDRLSQVQGNVGVLRTKCGGKLPDVE